MAVSAASGTPQYSGVFIPEIWSSNLLVKFYTATVFAAISNTDYEGEIKNQGDKVIISQVASITIRDYSKNMEMVVEHPEAANVELVIDKAKYFNFVCDDIDKHQTHLPLMEKWSDDAGRQMQITIDAGMLGDVYADASSYNKGSTAGYKSGDIDLGATGSPVVLTSADILDKIVDCSVVLSEYDVPPDGRWGVIPVWMKGMVMKSDLKDASLAGDGTSIIRNGRIGRIADFVLYESNQLTSASDGGYTCYHTIFGHPKAISFAAQMTKTETVRSEHGFYSLVRGLNVCAYKALKTQALIDFYVRKGV